MFAAAMETFCNAREVSDDLCASSNERSARFEPVSRLIDYCDAKSLEVSRPVCAVNSNR